jgi:hypothetical protein
MVNHQYHWFNMIYLNVSIWLRGAAMFHQFPPSDFSHLVHFQNSHSKKTPWFLVAGFSYMYFRPGDKDVSHECSSVVCGFSYVCCVLAAIASLEILAPAVEPSPGLSSSSRTAVYLHLLSLRCFQP